MLILVIKFVVFGKHIFAHCLGVCGSKKAQFLYFGDRQGSHHLASRVFERSPGRIYESAEGAAVSGRPGWKIHLC
jgi:hypothetical protein